VRISNIQQVIVQNTGAACVCTAAAFCLITSTGIWFKFNCACLSWLPLTNGLIQRLGGAGLKANCKLTWSGAFGAVRPANLVSLQNGPGFSLF